MIGKAFTVDIIITTRNNASILRNNLTSVAKQTFLNYHCYVVDDCSTDETATMVANEFPWAELLISKEPRGPSYNSNVAAAKGSAPFIVTLDDDTVLTDDWLEEMVGLISSSPVTGAVGSRLLFVDRPDKIMGIGCFLPANGLGSDMCFNISLNTVHSLAERLTRIVYACSAAMIIRRSAFEKSGGFDPLYFYMSEDYDLGLRINSCGYLVIYNPRAIAYHHYHKAARNIWSASEIDYLYYRNGLCTILKNFSPVTILSMAPYFLFGAPEKLLVAVKAIAWNLFHIGHIVKNRHYIGKHRIVVESDVLTLNLFLRSLYKYGIVPLSRQTKGLLWKKRMEKLPFIISPLLSRCFENVFHKNRYVDNIIFFVTNLCNVASCKHCFLRNDLNKDVDKNLSLQEIEKFFISLGKTGNIVLGGGEPFLRDDIDRICMILEQTSQPRTITIPTNGLASEIIFQKVKSILEKTQTRIIISLSIDGPPKVHDEIRQIPGLFDKVRHTYSKLLFLYYMFYPRLTLQVNSVLFNDNYKYLRETYNIIKHDFPQAKLTFEVIRGHYDSSIAKPITSAMYGKFIELLRELKDPLLDRSIRLHRLALKTIKREKQVVLCNAGRNFIVLDYLGNLYPCEILPSFVNIRDIEYNFLNVAKDSRWHKIVKNIRKGKCYCTHMCFLGSSLHDGWGKLKMYIKKDSN